MIPRKEYTPQMIEKLERLLVSKTNRPLPKVSKELKACGIWPWFLLQHLYDIGCGYEWQDKECVA